MIDISKKVENLDKVIPVIKKYWYGDNQDEIKILDLVFNNRKDLYFKDFPEIIESLKALEPDQVEVLFAGGIVLECKNDHVVSVSPCISDLTSMKDPVYWNLMNDYDYKEHLTLEELKKQVEHIKIHWKYEKD